MIGYKKTSQSKQEWLTPPWLIEALGSFDLDPCAPVNRPWDTAKNHFTIDNNGLLQQWQGRVWLNPPFDSLNMWLMKMSEHNNGIALLPARTETEYFHNYVFPVAESILFLNKRIKFLHRDGTIAKSPGGFPPILVAYHDSNSLQLAESGLGGKHVLLNSIGVVMVGFNRSWKWVVRMVLVRNSEAGLMTIYNEVEAIAPDKVKANKHFKEKVRQTLQLHFKRVRKGVYKLN